MPGPIETYEQALEYLFGRINYERLHSQDQVVLGRLKAIETRLKAIEARLKSASGPQGTPAGHERPGQA